MEGLKILLFQLTGFQSLILKTLILTISRVVSIVTAIIWQFAMSFLIIKYLAEFKKYFY